MKKVGSNIIPIVISLSLLMAGLFVPQMSAMATSCYGSTCYPYNPMVYTDSQGVYCASPIFTYTVAGSPYPNGLSGSYGKVLVELRYSDPANHGGYYGCKANWSRATVLANNASTVQIWAKAYQTYSPSYKDSEYIYAHPLAVNSLIYSYMIDGSVTVTAVGGITNSVCTTNHGDSCTYNPTYSYSG